MTQEVVTCIGPAECAAAHSLQRPDQVLLADSCAGRGSRQLSMKLLQTCSLSRDLRSISAPTQAHQNA